MAISRMSGDGMSGARGADGFPTTQWSLILAAGSNESPRMREALAGLCQAYWYPVYARIRRGGKDAETARDLTQGFFTEVLEKRSLAVADPDRGRFRCFLAALVRHFLSHEMRRTRSIKRGGGTSKIELDFEEAECRYGREMAHGHTPEKLFERAWARTLLSRVLKQMREECAGTENEARFRRLEPYLAGQSSRAPYAQVASDLGMTEAAVKTAVHRMRRRFGERLRAEVGETVGDPAFVDDEIRYLFSVFLPS